MTDGLLLILTLAVSSLSLTMHVGALAAQWQRPAAAQVERIAARGYIRTAACRVLAATVYTAAAAFQLAGARVHGGDLTPEALIIFASVQILWLSNAVADVRKRRELRAVHADQVGGHRP